VFGVVSAQIKVMIEKKRNPKKFPPQDFQEQGRPPRRTPYIS
jgi:hypothetical protein